DYELRLVRPNCGIISDYGTFRRHFKFVRVSLGHHHREPSSSPSLRWFLSLSPSFLDHGNIFWDRQRLSSGYGNSRQQDVPIMYGTTNISSHVDPKGS